MVLGLLAATPGAWACDCGIQIGSGSVVYIGGNVTTNCIEVASEAKLVITSGRLTLDGSGSAISTIDGTVELASSTSELAIVDNDHTFTGTGKVVGYNSSAKITISDGETLTSQVTIEGPVLIDDAPGASGTFTNGAGGLVDARRPGAMEIATMSLGSGSGNWRVWWNSSARLKFTVGSTSLTGDFTILTGTLEIGETICTIGDLTFTAGTVQVAPGKSFTGGGSCDDENPPKTPPP